MALTIGSVTVNADGTHSGSGLTLAIFDGYVLPPANFSRCSLATKVEAKTTLAARAQQLATSIVNHLIANGEVTVTIAAADAGLQKTPNPNNADTATQGPGAPVVLATKGTIT